LPLAHLLDEANRGRHVRPVQIQGLSFSAPHISFGEHCIWGATAMILGEFVDVLEEIQAQN
jgi:hypothetical protein